MSDIFLSYKHAQRREARELASALAARGWTVWWDWNIPAGAHWQAELDSQLGSAGCVLVLWSADSVQSEWVLYEARSALHNGKLIQALLEPVQPPPEFAALQAVDLVGWAYGLPFHAGFDRLRAAIRELLDRRAPLSATRSGTWSRTAGAAGDVVQRDSAAAPAPRARPAPVMLLPPPFPDLVDRAEERDQMLAALAERRSISLAGESGSGKSALLGHLGNLDHTARFHDGVVYLQGAQQGENDLAQALHEAFFDIAQGFRPSALEIRRNLADKTALLIVDDVALPPAGLDAVFAYAPGSSWVFASEVMAASTRRRPVALKGLATNDGVTLFERALAHPIEEDERPLVVRVVEAVAGIPARIEQAAGVAATHGVAAALAGIAAPPNPAELDSRARRVLAALACAGNIALEPEQCAAIAQVEKVDDVLAALLRRGLVQHVPPGFRLASGLSPTIEASPEYLACREHATDAFLQYAFEARGTPRRVARLAPPMMAQMAWAEQNGRSAEALRLARALDSPLADANRWDAWRDLLSRAHDIATRSGDDATAGWALHQQGTRALLLDDKGEARRLFGGARKSRKRSGDAEGLRATRHNLRLLGWPWWAILLTLFVGLGVTTLGAIPIVNHLLRPIPTLGPRSLDFGAQDLRAAAPPRAIQIGNEGRRELEVADVGVDGQDARSFTIASSCNGVRIRPGLACPLLVQFKPDRVGPHAATVVIRARDIKESLSVSLRGEGTAAPVARLSANSIDFGEVEIGASASGQVTLRNDGSAPLTATALATEGDSDFRILRDGCRSVALAPGASCMVELRFAPSAAVGKQARLLVHDNASGSPRIVALAGTGHATPRLEVAPSSLAFGRQEIGTQSPPRQIRLRNAGNIPIAIRQASLQGSNTFRLQDRCSNVELAPDSECVIEVRFAPSAIEGASGQIVIASSAGNARSIDLQGNGFGRPVIDVAPTQIDFGVLKRGATPKPRTVTVGNSGSDTLLLRARRVEGDGRFTMTDGCPDRLAPGARCSIEVGVDPVGAGKLAARVVLAHNAAGAPSEVSLSAAIEAIQPPVIERFEANPATIPGPRNVELCYRARNAQRLALEPAGSQPQANDEGCVVRFVGVTTTFRLTAYGEGGPPRQESRTVLVAATPPPAPVIVEFGANPSALQRPGLTQLCFSALNADTASIAPGDPQPSLPTGGCVSRRVATTTTFRLTVGRPGAPTRMRETTVTVAPAPPPLPLPPPPIPKDGTKDGIPKGGGVILKDSGILKGIPGGLGTTKPLGWCCRAGSVSAAAESDCKAPARWFATKTEADKSCDTFRAPR